MLSIVAAGAVAVYVACSTVLLHYPGLLHRKKRNLFNCLHISHRGGAGEHAENTISAFEHAVNVCHTDMLELDCHMTADQQVVVCHDPDLTRCGRPDLRFSQVNYDDLPPLAATLPLDFVPGGSFDTTVAGDRQIPLLGDVFRRFPATAINIDLKSADRGLVMAVSSLIDQYQRRQLTVWGSSHHDVSQLCRRTNSSVPMFCSSFSVFKIVISSYLGLLPFLPIHEQFFEIPMPMSIGRFSVVKHRPLAARIIDLLMMRPFIFKHLQRRGIKVFVWVLNNEQEYDRALQLGCDAVMTDYPLKLRRYLNERNLPSNRASTG